MSERKKSDQELERKPGETVCDDSKKQFKAVKTNVIKELEAKARKNQEYEEKKEEVNKIKDKRDMRKKGPENYSKKEKYNGKNEYSYKNSKDD